MARGRHSNRKHGRDRRALLERQAQLMVELGEEQQRLAAAQSALVELDALEERLRRTVMRQERDLASYRQRLSDEAITLREWVRDVRAVERELASCWDRIGARAIAAYGGGREGVEKWLHTFGGGGYVTDTVPGNRGAMTTERAVRLQAIRGDRRSADAEAFAEDTGDALAGLARPMLNIADVPDGAHPPQVVQRMKARRAALETSTPHGSSADHLRAWWPLPHLLWDEPFAGLPAELGYDGSELDEPDVHVGAHDALRRGQMNALAAKDGDVLRDAERLGEPWLALPRFARPSDAIALRAMYAHAAHGSWLREAEGDAAPAGADVDDEFTWTHEPPTAHTLQWAMATNALRHAVPFWLPPAQAQAFLDGRAFDEDDLAEMRLPFQATLATFAEPPHIAGAQEESNAFLRALMHERASDRRNLFWFLDALMRTSDDFEDLLTPAQVIHRHGARVEGVVLLADGDGRLRDEVVWCLALGGAGAGRVGGRVVVPAARSRMSEQFAHVVAATAAVVSWASWHEPTRAGGAEVGDAPEAASGSGTVRAQDTVRVLNVARTVQTEAAEPTGRSVAPHVRRGHWRRQRHGPRATLVKRVWVNPTLVNAGRFVDVESKVYRLALPFTVV